MLNGMETCNLFKRKREYETDANLKDSGGWSDERERGLNAAGGVGGESQLDQLPLQLISGRSRRLEITGRLLRRPVFPGAPADERVDTHYSRDLLLCPSPETLTLIRRSRIADNRDCSLERRGL